MNGKPQGGQGQPQAQAQAQAQQPQKCPRCDSMNTKFCYYNNYSLSQPRYFCKSCRRYWTQGGTLRNVRVGGGCRKPKRPKPSPSSSSSAADPTSPPPSSQAEEQKHPSAVTSAPPIIPFYHGGGGYLSSLAAIQSQPFNQMNLLSGFGAPSSQPFYHQMGVMRGKEEEGDVYGTEQVQLIQSTTASSSTHHHDWTESFINNSVHHRGSDASLWSTTMSTVSTSGNSQTLNSNDASSVGGSFSLIPNPQWPDLPEYDPPP